MINPKHHQAILEYQLKMQQYRAARRALDQDEEDALTELIKQLDEGERTSRCKESFGETLRQLFYSGRGRTRLCISRASESSGVWGEPERDYGTP